MNGTVAKNFMGSCDTQQWAARTASCLPESDALIYLIGLCRIKTMNRDTKPSAASRSQTDQTIIAPIIPAVMLLSLNPQTAKEVSLPLRGGGFSFRRSQPVLA